MKHFIFFSTLFILGKLFAQSDLSVEMKITNSLQATGDVKIYLSKFGVRSKMVMNLPAGAPQSAVTMDVLCKSSDASKSYIINDRSKSYSVSENKESISEKDNSITAEKVGTETLSGFLCNHAKVFRAGKLISEFWTCKEFFPEFEKYNQVFSSSNGNDHKSDAEQLALKKINCDGFPVKLISIGSASEGVTIMEIIKTDKAPLDKNLFEIPSDYKLTSTANTIMNNDIDMNKIMNMSPEEREQWQKEMMQKYGGQKH